MLFQKKLTSSSGSASAYSLTNTETKKSDTSKSNTGKNNVKDYGEQFGPTREVYEKTNLNGGQIY